MRRATTDPTSQFVSRALQTAFPAHNPSVRLTCRRKDNGYNIGFGYWNKPGLTPPSYDEIYEALADRLVVLKAGKEAQLTLAEVKERFAIKYCHWDRRRLPGRAFAINK